MNQPMREAPNFPGARTPLKVALRAVVDSRGGRVSYYRVSYSLDRARASISGPIQRVVNSRISASVRKAGRGCRP